MQITKIVVTLALLLGIEGCTEPKYTQEESAYIVWKTPTLRYADQGFIYESPTGVKVEIYSSGQPLMRLRVDRTHICASFWQCLSKVQFNTQFLSRYYPPDTLEHIFKAEPIFGGEQIERGRNGFTQMLYRPHKYKIDYRVLNNQIIFRDTINEIQLKVIKQ
jgi:hypothetical protein